VEHSSLASRLLSHCSLKRLASRGGRNRSSTRLPVWGVNYGKGACTSPLFHFYSSVVPSGPNTKGPASAVTVHAAASVSLTENCPSWTVNQKNERPTGGSAARAWDGGKVIRSQFGFSCRSAALASSRTTHRSRQVTTVVILQKTQTTPDYLPSLLSRRSPVDSSPGSFSPVPPYFPTLSVIGS
jgi:hypothetical protein